MENNDKIRIELEDLVRVLKVVIQHVKEQRQGPVEISEDYYWEINQAQLYDPTKDPSDFSLGQLSDDWQRLSQVLDGEAPPIGEESPFESEE